MTKVRIKLKGRPSFEIDEADIGKYSSGNVPPTKPEKVVESVGVKYTEKELFDLNKSEQVALLEKLGAITIPNLEAGRVQKLLDLGATK